MKKILILGSEGFIGSHLVSHFLKVNWKVYGCDLFDRSTNNYHYNKVLKRFEGLEQVFKENNFDACINAAGNGSVPFSISNPTDDFESNSSDTLILLELIREFNPGCRYLHISSAAVYGNPQQLPVQEIHTAAPLSPYGWHKLIAEQLCTEYHQVFGLSTSIARPFSVYGPGLKKQLFWDIFQKVQQGNSEIVMWGSGKESRDFIYITDMVNAMHKIIDRSPMQADIYNIASGNESTIKNVTADLVYSLDPVLKISFNNNFRKGDPLNWKADISKLKLLGFQPAVDINLGIQKLAQWFKSLN